MLEIAGLTRRFGAVEALAGLDLAVPAGARLGLIGPNGSGKTTLLNVLTGLLPPQAGTIRWRGAGIAGQPPHAIARLGIARSFQNLRLIGRMTVFENVWLAQHAEGGGLWRPGGAREAARRTRIEALLDSVGLADRRDVPAAALPLPAQRRLELARALARRPALLLLDEPAGGMTPAETDAMADTVAALVPAETALILVEHKLSLILRLCARAAVLHFGRKIAEGPPAEVLARPDVAEIYLGRARAAA